MYCDDLVMIFVIHYCDDLVVVCSQIKFQSTKSFIPNLKVFKEVIETRTVPEGIKYSRTIIIKWRAFDIVIISHVVY